MSLHRIRPKRYANDVTSVVRERGNKERATRVEENLAMRYTVEVLYYLKEIYEHVLQSLNRGYQLNLVRSPVITTSLPTPHTAPASFIRYEVQKSSLYGFFDLKVEFILTVAIEHNVSGFGESFITMMKQQLDGRLLTPHVYFVRASLMATESLNTSEKTHTYTLTCMFRGFEKE